MTDPASDNLRGRVEIVDSDGEIVIGGTARSDCLCVLRLIKSFKTSSRVVLSSFVSVKSKSLC